MCHVQSATLAICPPSSSNDMDTYMSETTMPWTAIRYGHKLADKLRQDYKCVEIASQI